MQSEFDILKDVVGKLEELEIEYMLTGSFAMNYYAIPRMTRGIDIIIELYLSGIDKLYNKFKDEYYIDKDVITESIKQQSIFNILHNDSFTKIDFIIRKKDEYRTNEFKRRIKVLYNDIDVFIVSKEDLIISKLIWARDGDSDYQLRDVKNLMGTGYDKEYLKMLIDKLNLTDVFQRIKND